MTIINPETGEVIGSNLIIYDPTIAKTFNQGLAKAGLTKADLVLMKVAERQEMIKFIAARGLGYNSIKHLLNTAPMEQVDQWYFMCGRISMEDADIAEEVVVKILYDAWEVDPTKERLETILDHVLNEDNQGRYFKIQTNKKGETEIRPQPPFYMLNGFFNAIYLGKMTLDEVVTVFKKDVNWQTGTVRKAAEIYGGAISTTMNKRTKEIKRLGKIRAGIIDDQDRRSEIEAEMIKVEELSDYRVQQLNTLYENAGNLSRPVLIRQRDKILNRTTKNSGPAKLTTDNITIIERIIPIPPDLPTEVYLDGKRMVVGGYKEMTLLMPLAKDGTSIPIYGDGYLDQLKGLIEQYKLLRSKGNDKNSRKR